MWRRSRVHAQPRSLHLADQRLSGKAAKEARTFLAHYYELIDTEDLAGRAPEHLYGAAILYGFTWIRAGTTAGSMSS